MPYSLVTCWPLTVTTSPVGSWAGMIVVPSESVSRGTYAVTAGSDLSTYVPSGSPGTTTTGTVLPVAGSTGTVL